MSHNPTRSGGAEFGGKLEYINEHKSEAGMDNLSCSICNGVCTPFDVVDFNKSCEEAKGKFLELSGIPVYYYLCGQCGFCFAPEICGWSLEKFSEKIYNKQYIEVDPEYKEVRPEQNYSSLINMFKGKEEHIRHLDYGGGNGLLSKRLKDSGWDSTSYDPFINPEIDLKELGYFNFITAYEVFEHVPDVNHLMFQLNSLLEDDGIILFSTVLSDGSIKQNRRLTWWYASPRNGHISLFSKNSLDLVAKTSNFRVTSSPSGLHIFYRNIPGWSAHLFRTG